MSLTARCRRVYLLFRAIPKTLRFNFRYFGPRGLLELPVLVSHRVKLARLSGTVTVRNTKRAAIQIGFGNVGIFDEERSRTIWENEGRIQFDSRAVIGHGSKISVASTGRVLFGDHFTVTAESTIRCATQIVFGSNCLLSWDILVMDQDFHPLIDQNGRQLNPDQPIIIGDNVWIGCRSLILKGSIIPPGICGCGGDARLEAVCR